MIAFPDRVRRNTASRVNDDIDRQTNLNILYYADHPDEIPSRLAQLDAEWDIERTLQAAASTLTLLGITLGARVDRRLLIPPAVVAGFLLLHAVQGWCPPLPILRRLGVRTTDEINQERYALKALRGDFDEVAMDFEPNTRLGAVLSAVHE